MAALLRPQQGVGSTIPLQPVCNVGSRQADGLVAWYVPQAGAFRNFAPGSGFDALPPASGARVINSQHGLVGEIDGTAGDAFEVSGGPQWIRTDTAYTVAYIAYLSAFATNFPGIAKIRFEDSSNPLECGFTDSAAYGNPVFYGEETDGMKVKFDAPAGFPSVLNRWSFGVFTFNGTAFDTESNHSAWIDGVAMTNNGPGGNFGPVDDNLTIGRMGFGNDNGVFDGLIKEVRIYSGREFTNADAIHFFKNPWDLYATVRRKYFFPAAGGTTKNGTASASYTWTGSVAGSKQTGAKQGTASATWTWTGSAAAIKTARATASASWAWTASVAGTAKGKLQGTASASWLWTATAAAIKTARATASASWAWTASVAGRTIGTQQGSASATIIWTASAAGTNLSNIWTEQTQSSDIWTEQNVAGDTWTTQ